MNIQRFMTLPNIFKPLTLLFGLFTMLLANAAPGTSKDLLNWSWFFWLNMILQLVFMLTVCGLFLCEAEAFLFFSGIDFWPIVEMSYCGAFATCNLLNMCILANWQKSSSSISNTYFVATLSAFLLVVFYGMSGIMMHNIWKGFVKSGPSQNPMQSQQAGNVRSIHADA